MVSPEEEHSEMILRGNLLAAASFLVFVMGVFTVPALSCKEYKYEAEGRCCPMCFPGWRVESHCTESSWTRCVPCTDGTFLDKPNGQKQCDTCRSCDPGLEVKQPCTAWSDTVCGAKEGFYCSNPTESGCAEAQPHTATTQPHRQCPEGQIKVKEGSLTGDVVCSSAHRSRPGIVGAFTVFGLMVIGVLIKGQTAKKCFHAPENPKSLF
ncbi:tumor necrosis factor receptor superfamily member 14-like isoform 4-T9 [Menidia menidia]